MYLDNIPIIILISVVGYIISVWSCCPIQFWSGILNEVKMSLLFNHFNSILWNLWKLKCLEVDFQEIVCVFRTHSTDCNIKLILNCFIEFQIYSMEECLELYGNHTNIPLHVACLDHAPVLTQSTMIKSFVLSLMAILSLLGNVATMLSIKRSKRHRSAHIYTLIYHLSIADLFVTFWCILGDTIW